MPRAGGNQLIGTLPNNLQLPPNLVAISLANNRCESLHKWHLRLSNHQQLLSVAQLLGSFCA